MYSAARPGAVMTSEYDREAAAINEGRNVLVPGDWDPADTSLLVHAPGYPLYLSAIYSLFGRSYFTVQLVQNLINSISPVLIFFIAGLLITWPVGIVSGLLAAVSHHLGYYSNLILPDSLSALPILLAILTLIKTRRASGWWVYAITGLLIGAAVWMRPNALLMGPLFALLLPLASVMRRQVAKRAWIVAVAPFLIIAPITIRNYLVYGEFIPVSTNMGIVLWEGIADAGGERFGAVSNDEEVAAQEAVWYNDPRYANSWSAPDGIKRDRDRIKRSLRVIAENPVWFAGAMMWRMKEMVKYSAHAPLVFRSSDTGMIEAAEAVRQEEEARREKKKKKRAAAPDQTEEAEIVPGPEEAPDFARRFSLAYGESIYRARPVARSLQRLAKETVLFFILLGAPIIFFLSPRRGLLIFITPLYYLLIQSVMHTEFRYTLPMHYFLFI
ncbi:MAG TPA: glycosyltransferase family 39 protein, partial [Blastocatellia bacterium]|nr:glycosyltransferase family 39 protein [Blastocatellia bacterium]